MLLLLLACPSDPTNSTSTDSGEMDCVGAVALTESLTGETWGGMLTMDFEVAPDVRSFLVTFQAEPYVFVYEVTDPSGTVVYDYDTVWSSTPYKMPSSIAQPVPGEVQLSWPLHPDDPPPAAGTWSVQLYVLSESLSPVNVAPVSATVYQSLSTVEGRCLSAQVVLADSVSDDADLVAVIEDAVARWTALYAAQGITLTTTTVQSDLDTTIALPADGDAGYAALDAQVDPEVVTVIIGESFSGNAVGVLGQTGGLPGPLLTTDRAAVGVSWLMNAGLDATFSEDEIQMFSETLAHEVGHYLGLMHPVQYDESYTPIAFDVLDDTPMCGDYDDCEDDLGDNLMYPLASCWWGTGCDPQNELTADQATMMRLNVGVR